MTGMSDRVCVDLCSLMKPGILSPSVLVGSFARGLFLVHSQSNYIATRPFAVNTGLSGCPIRAAGCIVPLKKSEGTKLTSSEGSTKLASFSMCYAAQLYGLLCILRIIWSYVNSVVFADCFICTCITQ
ncbi:putative 3-dehydroquinate synthase II [Helianthus annuus]|uniref:3-dehydroquinate synthase II n=1 Tax=Helianthus annuus TaxID=4232 RepID=A0A9K3N7N9_HELAN|nr:putative 3-dehydroquinate synthase II [Helianthus annuus]KAJ0832154.1 putative 3-dehydroquinate synthase II [Helianthus annuus]